MRSGIIILSYILCVVLPCVKKCQLFDRQAIVDVFIIYTFFFLKFAFFHMGVIRSSPGLVLFEIVYCNKFGLFRNTEI